jgi:FkbM family methyltransferase
VITFEATPLKVKAIKAKIESENLSQFIRLEQAACSNYTGTAQFRVMEGEAGSQQDSMAVPWTVGQTMDVPVVQLDDFVGPEERVAFLKIDTQGHEVQVLKGAKRMLAARTIDLIHVEYSPRLLDANLGGMEKPTALLELLYDYGYQSKYMRHAHTHKNHNHITQTTVTARQGRTERGRTKREVQCFIHAHPLPHSLSPFCLSLLFFVCSMSCRVFSVQVLRLRQVGSSLCSSLWLRRIHRIVWFISHARSRCGAMDGSDLLVTKGPVSPMHDEFANSSLSPAG